MTIGVQISAARRRSGWSQTELAQQMKVTLDQITAWETDRLQPTNDQMQQLERLLAISLTHELNTHRPEQLNPHLFAGPWLKLLLFGVPTIFLIAVMIPVIMIVTGGRYSLMVVSISVVSVLFLLILILLLVFHLRDPLLRSLRRLRRENRD
ncbi:helix-turn-helix domain-containing protein [Lapidilactobacillus luobeiensis]|uniref:helix-turn-helix domain-containing protein n=1 Tax=Lapidilactobacillus luobeiensis TaxID=2950371 RepID=UPI0021C41585|nr:helix-turn-helix domain-containing protein [Lapidilactobacillus luobeiensis]